MFCNFCGKVVFTLKWVYGKQDDNVRCTSVLQCCRLLQSWSQHTHSPGSYSQLSDIRAIVGAALTGHTHVVNIIVHEIRLDT